MTECERLKKYSNITIDSIANFDEIQKIAKEHYDVDTGYIYQKVSTSMD